MSFHRRKTLIEKKILPFLAQQFPEAPPEELLKELLEVVQERSADAGCMRMPS